MSAVNLFTLLSDRMFLTRRCLMKSNEHENCLVLGIEKQFTEIARLFAGYNWFNVSDRQASGGHNKWIDTILFSIRFAIQRDCCHWSMIIYYQFIINFRGCKRWMKNKRTVEFVAIKFKKLIKFICTADVDYCLWSSYRLFGYRTNHKNGLSQAEVWSIFSTWYMH